MFNFRTYQTSLIFFKCCKTLQLPYYLKDQLLRASSSITLNLAEGAGKESKKEQAKYYRISYASLCECRAAFDLHEIKTLNKQADELAALIYCLIKSRK